MADNRIGTRLGDYLIEGVLGRGGMGVVYRAVRKSDGESVALKLMLPELAANADFRQRFVDEAEVAPRSTTRTSFTSMTTTRSRATSI